MEEIPGLASVELQRLMVELRQRGQRSNGEGAVHEMKEKPRRGKATEREFSKMEGVAYSVEYSFIQGGARISL